ncbi:methylmalonyl-CoA mutase family protein [Luteipulveratus mongoliensis]|uniref:Methylmalonyl-CoA mutase alpha/beta chain catalytic domain-containing protein n=1 Tax=Luteipulveratus mongoliensis TaxID=571913 RepID=A0A0K1JJ02_9MICO|nr:methylmalonyl-CoA mutase family protein [Luteipulveratus mongoliensis]AKU16565.1 hypothetical protein VV02_13015 [Luteipulveratus mongoliensis]
MIDLDDDAAGPQRSDEWQDAARAVLAKQRRAVEGDPRQLLDSATVDGVPVPALAEPLETHRAAPGAFPFVRGGNRPDGADRWDVRAWMSSRDAADGARVAEQELEGGSTSLWVVVGGDGTPVDAVPDLLGGVYLDLAPVVVEATGDVTPLSAARALSAVVESRDGAPHPRTNLGIDPFGRALRHGGAPDVADVGPGAELGGRLGIRSLIVDGTAAADLGAGDVAEVAFLVASGLECLRVLEEAGVGLRDALGQLEFRVSVTDEQFVTIAKLRAARLLWAAVTRECGAAPADGLMRQHAVTSRAMLTRYDPWTNLLRTTVAAFAAGVAGAESVTVLPFDTSVGRPVSLSRRMARNISTLLVDESHVAIAADPAGGSYAVERLTDDLAEAAWARVQQVEAVGGMRKALVDKTFQEIVEEDREARRVLVGSRRRPVTGVSEFPLAGETLLQREPWSTPQVSGWAADFERLRDESAPVPVVLATMGPVAEHTARASFATNLLTAGGVRCESAGATAGPADVVPLLAKSGTAAVVVLAGSDAQYASDGAAYIEALRQAGAEWVVLAGKPSPEMAPLVDDHIATGQDAIDVLQRLRARLEGGHS